MPDRRRHRSAAPEDAELFSPSWLPRLRVAAADFAWLLERGYPERSALALVGDRFALRQRQREAVARATCAPSRAAARDARRVPVEQLAGRAVAVDGFNVLTTIESALGGAPVLLTADGCARDLARLRGTWRRVEETEPALELLGALLARRPPDRVTWWLDAPVSNSGRLAALLRDLAARRAWPWEVRVERHVDRALVSTGDVLATADSAVLDACRSWTSLARTALADVPDAWSIDLGPERA